MTHVIVESGSFKGLWRISTHGQIVHYSISTLEPYKPGDGPATLLAYGVPLPKGVEVARTQDEDVQVGYDHYALSQLSTEIDDPAQVKRLLGVIAYAQGAPIPLAIHSGPTNWGAFVTTATTTQMRECLSKAALF